MKAHIKSITDFLKHYGIHILALTLTIGAIVHTMRQFSEDPVFQCFFMAGGVFVALYAQYLRGRAAAHRKRGLKGDKGKAFGLWVMVVMYIVIFEFTSALGVLITQADAGEQVYTQIVDTQKGIKEDLRDIKEDIKTKKKQRDQEFLDKGRGPKYDKFEADIAALEAKKTETESKLNITSKASSEVKKTIFIKLSEKTTIPAPAIELSMFLALMFLIYSAPLLTPWKIEIEPLTEDIKSNPMSSEDNQKMSEDNGKFSEEHQSIIKPNNNQLDFISFIEELFRDCKEPEVRLNSIENMTGIQWSKKQRFKKALIDMGAIETGQGKLAALWDKEEIIEHIKNSVA